MKGKKLLCVAGVLGMTVLFVACGKNGTTSITTTSESSEVTSAESKDLMVKEVVIDYADAQSFEEALNRGENLEGKIVQFVADELHPQSAYGYNIWAGEHLNFISSRNPDVKQGEKVIVRTNTIESIMKSWYISYEKVENAVVGDTTVFYSENTELASEQSQKQEISPLELKEYSCYVNASSFYSDNVHIDFCGIIYNPNTDLIAKYPKLTITVKNKAGNILATDSQMGMEIMPDDTITLIGSFSMLKADVTSDAQVFYNVSCSDVINSNLSQSPRSTDFEITNISERNGNRENFITGEVTNTSDIYVNMANLSMILRKDGEIVFMENTFIDDLASGMTQAFQFQRYENWPEHDSIEITAQNW